MACSAAFGENFASSTKHSQMIFQAHSPVSTIQAYARNIRQSSLSKTPVLFADRPNHERASADGAIVWPCLRRRVKPNHPSDGTDDTALVYTIYRLSDIHHSPLRIQYSPLFFSIPALDSPTSNRSRVLP
jgi:hypothetical protein